MLFLLFSCEEGGLVTKSIDLFNKALIGMLAWKFIVKSSFLYDFLRVRYLPMLKQIVLVLSPILFGQG